MIFRTVPKSPRCHLSPFPLDLWQPGAPLCPEGPRAYRRVMSLPSPDSRAGLTRALCGAGKGACPPGHKSAGRASSYLQRTGFPPWFTAPTETKLGTATVSAPGPLSSGQDEFFAEDIQMYKEQIRLTQSSFAPREKKKRKRAEWLQKDLLPSASSPSERGSRVKTALCIQSANSQLIPLIHSWSTFNCVSSHSKDMFVAFNWRPLWNHSNVWLVGPT